MAKWNHSVRGSAPDTPAFAATWLGGKAGVNALTFPEPQAICAESPRQSAFAAIAVQIEFVHTGNIGSKCLQFDVQPLVFENKPLLARKELQLAVAGTPPRSLTRAF